MGLPLFSRDFSGSNILKKQKRPERSTYLNKIFLLAEFVVDVTSIKVYPQHCQGSGNEH